MAVDNYVFDSYGPYALATIEEIGKFSAINPGRKLKNLYSKYDNHGDFYDYVQKNIRKHNRRVETVMSSQKFLESGKGDCKNFTTLFSNWGLYHGMSVDHAVMYDEKSDGRQYYHIYPIIDGKVMDVYTDGVNDMANGNYELRTIRGLNDIENLAETYGEAFLFAVLMVINDGYDVAVSFLNGLGLADENTIAFLQEVPVLNRGNLIGKINFISEQNGWYDIVDLSRDTIAGIHGFWSKAKKVAKKVYKKGKKYVKKTAKTVYKRAKEEVKDYLGTPEPTLIVETRQPSADPPLSIAPPPPVAAPMGIKKEYLIIGGAIVLGYILMKKK